MGGGKEYASKTGLRCPLSLYCLQSALYHLFQETGCGEVKSSPSVCVSIIFNQNWNVLSDPWHLGESWGTLAYCFARTLLTDLCHTFPFTLGYASLPRCLWISCLWPFSYETLCTPTLEFSCKGNVSIVVCCPSPMSLSVRVPGTYIYIYFLFPVVSMISPSLVDSSDDDQNSWLPQTLQWQDYFSLNFISLSISLYWFLFVHHHKLWSYGTLDLQTSTRRNYW